MSQQVHTAGNRALGSPAHETVHGTVATGFEPVRDSFADLLTGDGDVAGQFCAYLNDQVVADLWAGDDVAPDDLQGVFSSTKGVSGICVALLVERGVLDLDAPMSRYWPEFAAAGKEAVTVRMALSHQAGLIGVEPQRSLAEMFDHDSLAARLAAQVPHWQPGKAHGYHALTMGTLIDELIRRAVGLPVAEFFRQEIGDPRGIDFYIRTPPEQEPRVKPVLPMRPADEQQKEPGSGQRSQDSLSDVAFITAVLSDEVPLPNVPGVRAAGQAASSGVGSARGLARLYAMCISEVDSMPPLLSAATVAAVSQIQSAGEDIVLRLPVRYAIVFQKSDDRLRYGSHRAFGHDGAGGSIGVADPWYGLSYAWIPRRMSYPGGADERGLELARVLRNCI